MKRLVICSSTLKTFSNSFSKSVRSLMIKFMMRKRCLNKTLLKPFVRIKNSSVN